MAAEEGVAASLLHLPREAIGVIARCLEVKTIGNTGSCSTWLALEVQDAELWFHLFMQTCWPPSDTLLAFAEECGDCLATVDWRARLRARASAAPAIVADLGRGYSKYTVVHGIHGRSTDEAEPPQLVQICSSRGSPPECGREEQLNYIQYKVDDSFQAAALDFAHPLHASAVLGAKLKVGAKALLRGRPTKEICRLISCNTAEETWMVEPLEIRAAFGDEGTGIPSATSAPFAVPTSQLLAIRCATDLPLLIGEPFAMTVSRQDAEMASTPWAEQIRSQLEGRAGTVQIAPQAQMSLWAYGVDHGIVVNIGQSQMTALPIVNGEGVASASFSSNVGGGGMTLAMYALLSKRFSFIDDSLMSWCRDTKEKYCYVAPPANKKGQSEGGDLAARLAAADGFHAQHISIEHPLISGEFVDLADERVLVPELLFRESREGAPPLPALIAMCAERLVRLGQYEKKDVQKLLQQIVLVGGGAEFPGLRSRTEFEVRALLRQGAFPILVEALEDPDEVFVLNPPLGKNGALASPRYIPVVGGCVRAACSLHFRARTLSDTGGFSRHCAEVAISDDNPGRRLPEQVERRSFLFASVINAGASSFRAGGGGGADDNIWQYLQGWQYTFHNAQDEESSDEDEEQEQLGAQARGDPARRPVDDSTTRPGGPQPQGNPSQPRQDTRPGATRDEGQAIPRSGCKGNPQGKAKGKKGKSQNAQRDVASGYKGGNSKGGKGAGSRRGAGSKGAGPGS